MNRLITIIVDAVCMAIFIIGSILLTLTYGL